MKTALIVGSTGLIGKQLLQLLLDDPYYIKVKAVARKPLALTHPRLEVIVADLNTLNTVTEQFNADDVFCCLGTTIKKAGSKKAFEAVDFDYPMQVAKHSKEKGAQQFLLVSALGADANSSFYYNQVKGRIEVAIREVKFSCTHVFRPSLLLGIRDENRPGEDAAKIFYRIFNFMIPKKYKGIDAAKVAKAMLSYAKENKTGFFVHESESMQRF